MGTDLLLALAAGAALAAEPVRLAAWNVETVGASGTSEYEAALDILLRIDADVVAFNEVLSSSDVSNLEDLAAEAGYPYTAIQSWAPYGSHYNGVVSRFPIVADASLGSVDLSGDASADDLTREILQVVVDVPGDAVDLVVLVNHWKSSDGDDEEFRRMVESRRMAQAVGAWDPSADAVVVCGDLNEELIDLPLSPSRFTSLPSGLPSGWTLGSDLDAELGSTGLTNDPFAPLTGAGLVRADIEQLDGSDVTWPGSGSGSRLDYLHLSDALVDAGWLGEVYDSADEGRSGGLPKVGTALASSTSGTASDHHLLFLDLTVPSTSTGPVCGDGLCDLTEDCVACLVDCGESASGTCGDGVCDAASGEDCLSCATDCAGRQLGPPSSRFCCGDGAGTNPVCDDPRCDTSGRTCVEDTLLTCCGDGTCDGLEDAAACPDDCTATSSCDGDGTCEPGEDCVACAIDCAGLPSGPPASRFCCGDGSRTGLELSAVSCDGNW